MRVGIIGGGQLGRMTALAGYALGLRFRVLEENADCPAGRVADIVEGDYHEQGALERLATGIDAATYEFENVPVEAAEFLAKRVPVFPHPRALYISQDRLHEKRAFRELHIPTPQFAAASSREELDRAVREVGFPAVIKTRRFGYDGKGQLVARSNADVRTAWDMLGCVPLIVEEWVAFDREVALLGVRGKSGATAFYPLIETRHRDGILRVAIAPAPNLTAALEAEAEDYCGRLLAHLEYVGVLALELFDVRGRLLANELAPRVHNSGHWTMDAAETCQFENHLRAGLGLPLGSTAVVGCAAMLNLIGVAPPLEALLAVDHARVHLYDKSPRPGRKLGHVTVCAHDREALEKRMTEVLALITNRS